MSEPTHRELLDALHDLQVTVATLAEDVKATKDVVQAWGVVKGSGQAIIAVGKILVGLAAIVVVFKAGLAGLASGGR